MSLIDEEYEVVQDGECESILDSMHYSLLMENITEQISNPFLRKTVNFINIYEDRYKYLKTMYEDEEFIKKLKNERIDCFEKLLTLIENQFKFKVLRDEIDLSSTLKVIYDFFILNYTENIELFIIQYITKNKKSLILDLDSKKRNKDVSTITSKRIFKDPNDAILIANMSYIVNKIICTLDLDIEFLKYILDTDEDCVYNEIGKIFLKKDVVEYDEELYKTFLSPIINKEDGYYNIIINVQNYLFEKCTYSNNKINIV